MIPDDLSGYGESSIVELLQLLTPASDALPSPTSPADLERVGDLLGHRIVTLLREKSRADILAECGALFDFLGSAVGRSLEETARDTYAEWRRLARLLMQAAERTDPSAIPSLLREHSSHSQRLLTALVTAGGSMQRSELIDLLDISESQLSHLLRDLEKADAVARHRSGGREVRVEILPLGRRSVDQTPAGAPAWLAAALRYLLQAARGAFTVHTATAREKLTALGASAEVVSMIIDKMGALRPRHARPTSVTARARPSFRDLENGIVRRLGGGV